MAERIFSLPTHTIIQAKNPAITPKTIRTMDFSYSIFLKCLHQESACNRLVLYPNSTSERNITSALSFRLPPKRSDIRYRQSELLGTHMSEPCPLEAIVRRRRSSWTDKFSDLERQSSVGHTPPHKVMKRVC